MNFSPVRFLLCILTLLMLSSCLRSGDSAALSAGELERQSIQIINSAGQQFSVDVELAKTDEQRSQGLMYRKELPEGSGMLFIFEQDQILSFWMKNTYIPLSIAYIASDGRIIDIKDMEPESLAPIKSSRSVRYALEVPRSWFSRMDIGPGSRVILDF